MMRKRAKELLGVVMAISVLAGCGSAGIQVPERTLTKAQNTGVYKEAPDLAAKVESGELPPAEERLPEEPYVEQVESVGTYGGTIRRVYTGVSDWNSLNYIGARHELLVYVSQEGVAQPNLVESWEYQGDDNTTLVLKLHKGIKWSDGEPFTVDDILYDLGVRQSGNVPLEQNGLGAAVVPDGAKKIDDYTVELKLKEYYPIEYAATFEQPYAPEHYLKQFDPRYDDTKTWEDLTSAWCSYTNGKGLEDLPQLSPWKVSSYTDNGLIVAERNPYYWKVDQEGNQLPYVDTIEFKYVASTDSIPAMVAAGEIDFQVRNMQFSDYSYYKQNEEAGGYRALALSSSSLGPCIRLNYACEDLKLRELFRDLEFRKALSLGIDREAISDSLYFGLVEGWGACPLEVAPSYPGEEYAKMYTEYDPDTANEILDGLGLEDTNNDGIREIDGKPLTIVIDTEDGYGSGPVKGIELVAEHWRKLGIDAVVNTIERSLMLARWQDNSYTAYAWKLDGAVDPVRFNYAWADLSAPDYLWHNVGVPMQAWYHSDGKEGVEMPRFIQDINAKCVEALGATDDEERAGYGKELSALVAENLFVIPTTTYMECGVVNAKLKNVPETWISGNEFCGEKHIHPWILYYEQ